MRIAPFRAWFNHAVNTGWGAARRAGLAITRKVRDAVGKIEVSVGVGDDESSFAGKGSRAWLQSLEETYERIKQFFEKSTFERLSRLENKVRGWLGLPPRVSRMLPPVVDTTPKKKVVRPSGPPPPIDAEKAARFKAQVEQGRIQANTGSRASVPPPPKDDAK